MRPHRDGPRAALTLALCLLAADGAAAQQRYPSGPPGAKEYRLTLVALRKVLPALRADQRAPCEQRDAKRDPFAMTLAQMAAALERCAPVRTALAKTGVSTREAASVLGAFLYAGRRITEEESAKALGQQAVPLPPGPLQDNVRLLQANQAELRRLTQPAGGPGS